MPDPTTSQVTQRTWLERLGLALLGGEARSHDDLLAELRSARHNGVLDSDTLDMLEGVLSVQTQIVADVMVPRGQMTVIALDKPFDEMMQIALESGHSRFPVHAPENQEKLIGILLAKDLLKCFAQKQLPCDIRGLLRPCRLVPETKKLGEMLKEFRQHRTHMAIVVNEYGGIAGLVTIEDVLEEIVGPIDDEHDAEDKQECFILAQQEGLSTVRALMPIGEFNTAFDTDFSDEERDTIGGLLLEHFGHLPEVGESINLGGLHFIVSEADDRRLLSVQVHRPAKGHSPVTTGN